MGILLRAGGLVTIALSMLAGAALDHVLKGKRSLERALFELM